MVNASTGMRITSVSMAAVDIYNGTNIGYSAASSGNATNPPMSWLYDNLWTTGPGGNVGIGTSSPGAKLEVDGGVKLTSGSGASMIYADGTVQSTAWTGTLTGGDYAESMDVTGSREQYEPGDVLVLDPNHPGDRWKRRRHAMFNPGGRGVYSTRPGAVGRRQKTDKAQDGPHRGADGDEVEGGTDGESVSAENAARMSIPGICW